MRDPFTLRPQPRQYGLKFTKEINTDDDKLLMEAIISNYDLLMILYERLYTVKLYQSKLCDDGVKTVIVRQCLNDISLEFYEEMPDPEEIREKAKEKDEIRVYSKD